MAKEAIYEVNSAIEFKYRCNGDPATASPTAKVLDETGVVIDIVAEPIFDIALVISSTTIVVLSQIHLLCFTNSSLPVFILSGLGIPAIAIRSSFVAS